MKEKYNELGYLIENEVENINIKEGLKETTKNKFIYDGENLKTAVEETERFCRGEHCFIKTSTSFYNGNAWKIDKKVADNPDFTNPYIIESTMYSHTYQNKIKKICVEHHEKGNNYTQVQKFNHGIFCEEEKRCYSDYNLTKLETLTSVEVIFDKSNNPVVKKVVETDKNGNILSTEIKVYGEDETIVSDWFDKDGNIRKVKTVNLFNHNGQKFRQISKYDVEKDKYETRTAYKTSQPRDRWERSRDAYLEQYDDTNIDLETFVGQYNSMRNDRMVNLFETDIKTFYEFCIAK